MYKIAVCDDDAAFLKDMEDLIKKNVEFTGDMEIECFGSGEAFLASDVRSCTLVVMDMCINTADGFLVAKRLREENGEAVIVFCSGVVEPRVEHFEVQPYRYIMKQTGTEKMERAISEALKYMKQRYYKAYIIISGDGKAYRAEADDVLFLYPVKRGTMLKVRTGEMQYTEYRSNQQIKEWYAELLQSGFEFPNVSYLVNMKHIRSVEKNVITMDDGTQILISRKCRKFFVERFALFFDKKYRRDTGR